MRTVKEINGIRGQPPPGAITYINTECPPEGLTINACGSKGTVVLYFSKSPDLSSAMYLDSITIMENDCKNVFMDCSGDRRRRQTEESEERIYIAIEGVGEDNEYVLNASLGDSSTPRGVL